MKLTVTVITKNEASNIAAALDSVSWADEIIVIDSGSTDGTVSIARPLATRVDVRGWPGYGAQKNHAAGLASNDWILSIDADERVTPGLAQEIRSVLGAGPRAAGYRIPRVAFYLGRAIRTTDWHPDFQLRLYDRRAARWNERRVHESVETTSRPGRLRHDLHHYPYRGISHHLATIDRYTTLWAEDAHTAGRRTNALEVLVHTKLAFGRNFVLKRGFTDGAAGLIVSTLNSYYVFLKLAKLWELEHRAPQPRAPDLGAAEPPAPDLRAPEPPAPEPRA